MEKEKLNKNTDLNEEVEIVEGNEGVIESDTLFESVMISVNCCVGGSIFGAPWGFAEAGWVLSTALAVLALMSMVSLGLIVLQVLSRMPIIHRYTIRGYTVFPISLPDLFKSLPHDHYIIPSDESSEGIMLINPDSGMLKNIKYDFTLICKTLLGKKMEKILSFLIVANSLIFLIGCTSTFASSMASLVPIGPMDTCNIYNESNFDESCRYKYIFFIIIFASIVSAMTLIWHFTESKSYLIGICITRIIVVLIMIVTAIKAGITQTELNSNEELSSSVPIANFNAFGISVPVIFLTMGFHVLIPDVEQPLKNKERNSVKMLCFAFFISFLLIVCLSLSMVFGCSDIERLSTLNWDNYSNGGSVNDRPYWTAFLEFIILLFPCADITSIFAMTTVNTADNIIALHYDGLQSYCVEPHRIFSTRLYILLVTLAVPMVVTDLGIIFALAGAFNIVFMFLFIIMFGIASKILVPEKCQYDNFLSNINFLRIFLVISLIFCIFMWISFAYYLIISNV